MAAINTVKIQLYFLCMTIHLVAKVIGQGLHYTDEICPDVCRCLDKGSVISCKDRALTDVPLVLSTAIALDLDHNRINIVANNSFAAAHLIQIISMEHNGIIHLEPGAFSTLTSLRILRLGSNHLSHLPKDLFWNNRQLEVLDLNSNAFAEIPDHSMCHLHSLKMLNISYNHLTSPLLGAGFKYTTQLSSVDLSGNNFVTLDSHVFQATLWWDEQVMHNLNLSYCNIRHIHPEALSKLFRLEALSLEGNSEIPDADLKEALRDLEVSSLQVLNLSHMNISDVYEYFWRFQHKNLEELYLSYNLISSIKLRTFYYLVNLRILDLSHNRLQSIGDLGGLSRLELLNLAHNELLTLDPVTFEGIQTLRYLDLSHNNMTSVDDKPFQTLWDLHTLDINSNRISHFSITAGLENLETLKISSNQISDPSSIKRLLRLKTLDISENLIVSLGSDVFALGQSLSLVNFSHNEISYIDSHAFRSSSQDILDLSYNRLVSLHHCGWRRLKCLYLKHSMITNISQNTFRGLNTLVEMDLSGNYLTRIKPDTLSGVYNLQSLSLTGNPLGDFFMRTHTMQALGVLQKLETLQIGYIGLSSFPINFLRNLTLLHHLDLSGNHIERLSGEPFWNLPRLTRLNMSANALTIPDPDQFQNIRRLRTLDLSHNPFQCTCALMPFRNWLFSTNITILGSSLPYMYSCAGPPEWKNIDLSEFHLQSNTCSHHETAVVFAAVGCAILAVALVTIVAIYRWRYWSNRKAHRTHYSVIDDGSTVRINPHGREWV